MPDPRAAFQFSRDFSQETRSRFGEEPPRMPVPWQRHVELVESARAEARAQGLAEGREAESQTDQARIAAALEAIAATLAVSAGEAQRIEQQARREALDFALVFARKLAGKLAAEQPLELIEATAGAILNDLRGSVHVAVRVAPALVDACKARLAGYLAQNGIATKLIVFPDPAIARGDCRIEWADGGIVRERAKLEFLVEKSIDMLVPATSGQGNPTQ